MSEDQNQAIADSDTPPVGLHFDDRQAEADREHLKAALDSAPRKLGALAPPPLAVSILGGQLIASAGGLVGFCPMGSSPAGQNVNLQNAPNQTPEFNGTNPPTTAQTNYMDVARWMPDLNPAIDDVTQTMALAQVIAVTLPQGNFTVEVINDARMTPDMLAKYGLINPNAPGGISANLGCRMTAIHGNPASYVNGIPDFYYCPCVKLLNPGTVIDAITKKLLRSTLRLICSAPVYHMPWEAAKLAADLAHWQAISQGF